MMDDEEVQTEFFFFLKTNKHNNNTLGNGTEEKSFSVSLFFHYFTSVLLICNPSAIFRSSNLLSPKTFYELSCS